MIDDPLDLKGYESPPDDHMEPVTPLEFWRNHRAARAAEVDKILTNRLAAELYGPRPELCPNCQAPKSAWGRHGCDHRKWGPGAPDFRGLPELYRSWAPRGVQIHRVTAKFTATRVVATLNGIDVSDVFNRGDIVIDRDSAPFRGDPCENCGGITIGCGPLCGECERAVCVDDPEPVALEGVAMSLVEKKRRAGRHVCGPPTMECAIQMAPKNTLWICDCGQGWYWLGTAADSWRRAGLPGG